MLLRKRNPNALDAPMTSAELAAARAALDMSPAQFADAIEVTLYELEQMEAGRKKIPVMVAVTARARLMEHGERQAMSASGLPECAEGVRLADRWAAASMEALEDGADTDEADAAHAALEAHASACAPCRARREYAERHVPPWPELSEGPFMRAMGFVLTAGERLPAPLRVPRGGRGDGRRIGMGMAAMFASFALLPLLLLTIRAFMRRSPAAALLEFGGALLFLAAYVATGFVSGWMWDALHPLRGRLAGYLLRGALVPATAFTCFGLMLSFLPDGSLVFVPIVAALTGVLGAVGGIGLWVWHRIRGKLPRPVTR